MPTYDLTYTFTMTCETRCLTVEAKDEDEALEKAQAAIVDGQLDLEKLGGDQSYSWRNISGSGYDFEIDECGIEEA